MNNQKQVKSSPFSRKNVLLLIQFFLIIFVYHTMKDLKDTVVITASSAGAEVIPFIKIWGMLPMAIGASYLFAKIYNRFGREKAFTIFTGGLVLFYCAFAFILYPLRDHLYLSTLDEYLKSVLPSGSRGFIAMISYWHYTIFYTAAEIWSILVLSILFWGFVNETTTLEEAKKFYPLCMFTGNFAGIISGQSSHYFSYNLKEYFSWEETMQAMILIVTFAALLIIGINKALSSQIPLKEIKTSSSKKGKSFKENLLCVCKSPSLICIAVLVIGFGLTSNLIEVAWKESIRALHPKPQDYNAYINQITTIIGIFAVCAALVSQWIFRSFCWKKVALITPVTLLFTSILFFAVLLLPKDYIDPLSHSLNMAPLVLIATAGSIHYVLGMTAKYTIFDACKEMAFLSVDIDKRTNAKSVIDSLGSRLGKTTASCLYQFLLIAFGSTSGHLPFIAVVSLLAIGMSVIATVRLGVETAKTETGESSEMQYAS